MFKLAVEVRFENYFGLIRAIFLSLGSSKSVYFFWDTRYSDGSFFGGLGELCLVNQTKSILKLFSLLGHDVIINVLNLFLSGLIRISSY